MVSVALWLAFIISVSGSNAMALVGRAAFLKSTWEE